MSKESTKDAVCGVILLEQENNGKLLERRNAALEERYVVQTAMASMAHVASSRSVRAAEDGCLAVLAQNGQPSYICCD